MPSVGPSFPNLVLTSAVSRESMMAQRNVRLCAIAGGARECGNDATVRPGAGLGHPENRGEYDALRYMNPRSRSRQICGNSRWVVGIFLNVERGLGTLAVCPATISRGETGVRFPLKRGEPDRRDVGHPSPAFTHRVSADGRPAGYLTAPFARCYREPGYSRRLPRPPPAC